ncbi:MAG: nucleotide disphospho-sugar-binding domain-containing protein, partial [Pseudomonadota bacterium]
RFLKNRGMKVHEKLPELSDVLARSSLIVSQGGAGLSNAALLVGRPHIVYPNHAESSITAAKLVDLKLGINIEGKPGESVPDAVEEILNDPDYISNAQAEAIKIAGSGQFSDGLARVTERVFELID